MTIMANGTCGCCGGGGRTSCAGTHPLAAANRAGLPALSLRVGTHGTFLEAMKERLAAADLPALAALRTRDGGDFAIALLDAWATIGDVVTFYQERIANEGYLRTATERLSVVELSRLVGFELRPGVAASVYLAYALNNGPEVPIPAGARVQSTPGPNESPQFFETGEELRARADWNDLKLRSSGLPDITSSNIDTVDVVQFAGAASNLKVGDRLLFKFAPTVSIDSSVVRQIQSVEVAFKDESKNIPEDRTTVRLVPVAPVGAEARKRLADLAARPGAASVRRLAALVRFGAPRNVVAAAGARLAERQRERRDVVDAIHAVLTTGSEPPNSPPEPSPGSSLDDLIEQLRKPPTRQPPNAAKLVRDPKQVFGAGSDVGPQLLRGFFPELRENLYFAFATPQPIQEVFVFRQTAFLFGHNAPKKSLFERPDGEVIEVAAEDGEDWAPEGEDGAALFLDNAYSQLVPGDLVMVQSTSLIAPGGQGDGDDVFLGVAQSVSVHARSAYRVSGPSTEVTFADPWWTPSVPTIRDAVVYTKAEKLPLAREPITDPIGGDGAAATTIELDRVYPGLTPGRWTIVSGLRRISDTVAIPGAELVMIAAVEQRDLLPSAASPQGDASTEVVADPHTVLHLAGDGLAFTYLRETVKIHGNVVLATHGETRGEVLGSGDATRSLQTFTLKKPPLTYVPAATASGVASTLEVRVNGIVWRQVPSLAGAEPNDRVYIVRVADDGTTSVIFGTGEQGARLPTGAENIKAVYRSGIGRAGNVDAEQVNVLQTRPLAVKEVINPLPASGGADPDTKDEVRRNAAESVTALDRLVSVSDYAAFARSFAGIAKAQAERLTRRSRPGVHVTIAGQENVPIVPNSLLFTSLLQAFERLGDPALPIEVTIAPVAFLFIKAGVRIAADRVWEVMVQQIRTRLLDVFGFDRRDLGQSVHLSEVVATIQRIDGVEYVDVDALDGVSETDVSGADSLDEVLETLSDGALPDPPLVSERTALGPRVVYLNPALPDLLMLQEITP